MNHNLGATVVTHTHTYTYVYTHTRARMINRACVRKRERNCCASVRNRRFIVLCSKCSRKSCSYFSFWVNNISKRVSRRFSTSRVSFRDSFFPFFVTPSPAIRLAAARFKHKYPHKTRCRHVGRRRQSVIAIRMRNNCSLIIRRCANSKWSCWDRAAWARVP